MPTTNIDVVSPVGQGDAQDAVDGGKGVIVNDTNVGHIMTGGKPNNQYPNAPIGSLVLLIGGVYYINNGGAITTTTDSPFQDLGATQ
jgi:hypothetical protein